MQAPTRARLSSAFRDSQEKSNRGRMLGPYSSTKASCRGERGEKKSIRVLNISSYYSKKSASAVPADRGRGI